jgi:hypothetical protein
MNKEIVVFAKDVVENDFDWGSFPSNVEIKTAQQMVICILETALEYGWDEDWLLTTVKAMINFLYLDGNKSSLKPVYKKLFDFLDEYQT